jgi:hypothetical protein
MRPYVRDRDRSSFTKEVAHSNYRARCLRNGSQRLHRAHLRSVMLRSQSV